jgi:hypothetical protein
MGGRGAAARVGGGWMRGGCFKGGGGGVTARVGSRWFRIYFDRLCTRWMALARGYCFPESETCGNETPGSACPRFCACPIAHPSFPSPSPPAAAFSASSLTPVSHVELTLIAARVAEDAGALPVPGIFAQWDFVGPAARPAAPLTLGIWRPRGSFSGATPGVFLPFTTN